MLQIFKTEITVFAACYGVNLLRKEAQVAEWCKLYGAEDNDVIRYAFEALKVPGAMKADWPSYQEIAGAFRRARARLDQEQACTTPAVREAVYDIDQEPQRESRIRVDRMRIAANYSGLIGNRQTKEDVLAGIGKILDPATSDEEVRQMIAAAKAQQEASK